MKLRRPCEHGLYDEHEYWLQSFENDPDDCPGGVFLPDDTLLFDRLQDQLEDMYCIRLQKLGVHERGHCQSFAADAVRVFRDALSVEQ